MGGLTSDVVPPTPDALLLNMAALIGGLMLFAGLLLIGTRIVRWLQLPQDLPEGPRFEPPPPPAVPRGDRAAAAVVAALQARLRSVYAEAHAVARAAVECQDLHQQVVSAGPVAPFAAIAPVTGRCSATAVTSATAAEQVLQDFDRRLRADRTAVGDEAIQAVQQALAPHALAAHGALAQAREAVAPLPDGGNRRLILLVVMLVVMIAWVVAMQLLLKK